ncbi:MAG: flagellar hook assembly protein FlgD [Candidatus Omnitrophota bacterium]
MIDTVSYLNSLTATPSTTQTAVQDSKEMGKDAFMQLLINQMANQDPLEPMDNSQFVSQLAQFSSLEQMQNVASSVEMLALSQTAATNSQMVNLIGKRVVVSGNALSIDSNSTQPIDLKYNLEGKDTPRKLMVMDNKGNVVRTMDLTQCSPGENTVQFDGKDDNGNALAPGQYTYKIVDAQGKTLTGVTTYSNLLVDAVSFKGTEITLKCGTLDVAAKDISQVIKN